MKILEIFTFDKKNVGGVSTMVMAYMDAVNEFARLNCHLFHLNIQPNITVGNSKIDNVIYIFTQQSAVKEHLRASHYDAVHIHTSREFLFLKDVLLAKLIKKTYRIPVVLTIHVGALGTVYNRIGWFKQKSFSLLNQYVDKVIFLSEAMRKDFIREGLNESSTSLLYNFYKFTPTETSVDKNSNVLQLLFMGAIHREKGILELLNALSQMHDFEYHLNVCGQIKDNSIIDDIEYYKHKLTDKVSFRGLVMGEEKTKMFMQSDILILPSYHEGLPLVIMEALGAGCGIMTTPVGAIPEILTNENCRWLEIASSESINFHLTNLSNEELAKMKIANKKLSLSYSFDAHVRHLAKIYKSLF